MSFKHEILFEEMIDRVAKEFQEITGTKLSYMRIGKLMEQLNWASSQKN